MFCRYCGTQIPDDARFCTRCGKSTGVTPPPENTSSSTSHTATDHAAADRKTACRYCGKEISRDAFFCPHCKRSTYAAPSISITDDPAAHAQDPQQSKGTKKKMQKKIKFTVRKFVSGISISPGKKKLLLILPAILVIALIVHFGSSYLTAHRTVAEIPDPEVFFGLDCKKVPNPDSPANGTITYTITSDEAHLHILEEYIDLLTSGQYPFRLAKSEHPTETYVRSSTESLYDYIFSLQYNGDEKLGHDSPSEIYIKYRGTGTRYCSEGTVTWDESTTTIYIHNANNFELVSAGKFTPNSHSHSDDSSDNNSGDSSNSGSSGNSSGYVVDYGSALPCTTCGGSGDCTSCGGAIGGCTSCYLSGNCRSCGGSGKRYP